MTTDRSSAASSTADSAVTGDTVDDLPDFDGVRWSTLDRDDYVDLYDAVVVPRLEADGRDPTTKPTHEWLREQGLRSFVSALRRHQNCTFSEFWAAEHGAESPAGYDWATDDAETVEALEAFLEGRRGRHDLAESSIDAKRRRLNLYVRAYVAANDDDDLLAPVARDTEIPPYRAVDACYAAFDWLNEHGYAARTKRRVRGVADAWYTHLVGRRIAGINPATGLYNEFRWSVEDSDPPSLDPSHVRALVSAADSTRDRLLVVALAGWGLRANEVAALHVSQIERPESPDSVPFVRFDERKNGPGEVSILYGMDVLDERIDHLTADDEWTGYLFPSSQGRTRHVTRGRVWAWFRDLAAEADVPAEIEGVRPSPQLARRFWYDTYTSVLGPVLEMVGEVAGEQGSSDPAVVVENYLQDERARELRRELMRERLSEAFDGELL